MKELLLSRGIDILTGYENEFGSDLPAEFSFPELPGAEVKLAQGLWGEATIQEYHEDNFSIRYSVFDVRTELAMSVSLVPEFLYAIIVLKGDFGSIDYEHPELKDGQFQFLKSGLNPILTLGPGVHISFEVMVSKAGRERNENFYDRSRLNARPPRAFYISEELREVIRYVLSYDGPEEYRRTYFEYKARDIIFQLFLLTNKVNEVIEEIPADQVNKAWAAERLIMEDLTNHLLIRELSRKVQTSETILKRAFKKVFGMGMHEYLVYQRLIRANRFLQDGCSVKETAAYLGWRSADLIKAYYKKYGTTPGTARRRMGG